MNGGGDSLHLWDHAMLPGEEPATWPAVTVTRHGADPVAAVRIDAWTGWYRILGHVERDLPARLDGRSWRIDVTVLPAGYLGRFRRSRLSGRMFSGRHRWHAMGASRLVDSAT